MKIKMGKWSEFRNSQKLDVIINFKAQLRSNFERFTLPDLVWNRLVRQGRSPNSPSYKIIFFWESKTRKDSQLVGVCRQAADSDCLACMHALLRNWVIGTTASRSQEALLPSLRETVWKLPCCLLASWIFHSDIGFKVRPRSVRSRVTAKKFSWKSSFLSQGTSLV